MWRRLIRGAVAAGTLAAIAYLSTKDDQVLCNTPEVYFAVTGFDHDETGFYAFVRCRNKTGKKLIFRCVRPSVLGYGVPIDFVQEAGPHETVSGSFWINIEFMKRYGIQTVDELSFWLDVREASSDKVLIHAKHILSPTGKAEYQLTYPEKKHTDTETVIAENEILSSAILGWRMTGTRCFVIDVLSENRSGEVLRTEWTNVLVNGKLPKQMIEFEQEMDPGIIQPSALSLYGDFFRDHEIEMSRGEKGIQEITFLFRVYKGNGREPVFERQVVWPLPETPDGLDV